MISLLFAAMLVASPAAEQSPPPARPAIEIPAADVTQELELTDGSSVIGRVESIGEGRFVFRSAAGVEMTVDMSAVRSLKPVTGQVVGGEFWREDPNPTRLFFGPTGRSLKQGEAYFGVYEVLLPFVQVGITDRLSFGAGTPLVFGDFERPFWITPKFQVMQRRSTAASVGVMQFFNMDDASIGIAYGVVTQGGTDSAVTVGAGYAYERSDDDDAGSAVVMLGGEHRVTRRVKLVTENYVFKSGGFVSGGIRLFGEKLSADFGLVLPLFDDARVLLPMINVVRKF